MDAFTPVSALVGGAFIGLAASVLLLVNGRIAGISGIYGGLLKPTPGDTAWRAAFVGGLLTGGIALLLFMPGAIADASSRSLGATALAGVLVGFGVRMGSGCTSGHGVCGITRTSPRSMLATATFMGTGILTASLITVLLGGSL
jgi:uncharacterized membrane protein YedE/YeeE